MVRSSVLSIFLLFCLPVSKMINRINWRFGRPFRCSYEQIDPVKGHLQPGMVILTHKRYEFSTLFIPGYWTHSALVTSPGYIIEATGKGVRMNTLETFFSTVDDFVVLKPRFCCRDIMNNAGKQASTLVGLPYSFDFRNSDEMFYCTGLICWVYTQTLTKRDHPPDIPFVFQNFLEGNIVRPMDLFAHQDAWQVIASFKETNRKTDDALQ